MSISNMRLALRVVFFNFFYFVNIFSMSILSLSSLWELLGNSVQYNAEFTGE